MICQLCVDKIICKSFSRIHWYSYIICQTSASLFLENATVYFFKFCVCQKQTYDSIESCYWIDTVYANEFYSYISPYYISLVEEPASRAPKTFEHDVALTEWLLLMWTLPLLSFLLQNLSVNNIAK